MGDARAEGARSFRRRKMLHDPNSEVVQLGGGVHCALLLRLLVVCGEGERAEAEEREEGEGNHGEGRGGCGKTRGKRGASARSSRPLAVSGRGGRRGGARESAGRETRALAVSETNSRARRRRAGRGRRGATRPPVDWTKRNKRKRANCKRQRANLDFANRSATQFFTLLSWRGHTVGHCQRPTHTQALRFVP